MKGLAICLLFSLTMQGLSASASAKDICVQDPVLGTMFFQFRKVKPLKKAGKVAPLHGIIVMGDESSPVSGTAIVQADGTVVIGIFAHSSTPTRRFNLTVRMEGDADFNASGAYDFDGDFENDAPARWDAIDCRTLTLP